MVFYSSFVLQIATNGLRRFLLHSCWGRSPTWWIPWYPGYGFHGFLSMSDRWVHRSHKRVRHGAYLGQLQILLLWRQRRRTMWSVRCVVRLKSSIGWYLGISHLYLPKRLVAVSILYPQLIVWGRFCLYIVFLLFFGIYIIMYFFLFFSDPLLTDFNYFYRIQGTDERFCRCGRFICLPPSRDVSRSTCGSALVSYEG